MNFSLPLNWKAFSNKRVKKRSPFGLYLNNGDAYGIRTRECMRERHVS